MSEPVQFQDARLVCVDSAPFRSRFDIDRHSTSVEDHSTTRNAARPFF